MGRWFHMSTDSDIDLNEFSEMDVEREFREGSTRLATEIGGPNGIDSIQRWMRDAKPGDKRTIGKRELICHK